MDGDACEPARVTARAERDGVEGEGAPIQVEVDAGQVMGDGSAAHLVILENEGAITDCHGCEEALGPGVFGRLAGFRELLRDLLEVEPAFAVARDKDPGAL